MGLDIATLGAQLGKTMLDALKSDSEKVKGLALAEVEKLAIALVRVGGLLTLRHVDGEEAALLVRVQKDAAETVLASLAEISRVAASKAVMLGLKGVAAAVDTATGVPILGPLFAIATA